jgi:type I restriction enzyme R subunit
LYVAKNLEGHNLLQAIARVNRLYPGKDFGYIIDYYGLLGELDKALTTYTSLAEFDEQDVFGCLAPIEEEVKKLPQRHSDLWEIFKVVLNKYDEEAYERLLADDAVREKFYVRLCDYAKNLDLALSTVRFMNETPDEMVSKYKEDLKYFSKLRIAVRKRYAEIIDYREYETKIQKLLDTHIVSDKVEKLIPLVNIFDKDAFEQELAKIEGAAAKADAIAHRTKKTIHEKMDEDPAFYKKFSKMLEEVIEEFKLKRISELQYLKKVQNIMDSVRNKSSEGLPDVLREKEHARAFYGAVKEVLKSLSLPETDQDSLAVDTGLKIDEIVERNLVVDWHVKKDIQNRMINEIEDYLFNLKDNRGINLDFELIDKIIEDSIQIAKSRFK